MTGTLFDKIWGLHTVIPHDDDNEALIFVDRNFVHEESQWVFDALRRQGRQVYRPERNFAFADHYVPTVKRELGIDAVADPERRSMVTELARNARAHRLAEFGIDDPRQGIMHVVAPELGLVLPGFVVTGSDSHTCTNGAFGALAFGVGHMDLQQIFLTQTVWRKRPQSMQIAIDGERGWGVTAKDVALNVAHALSSRGGRGYAVEYTGTCVAAMTMEERMTLCNLSVDFGAASGMVGPDEVTVAYLAERPHAPSGARFEEAVAFWRQMASDPDAAYDRHLHLNAATFEPMVTWGTALDDVLPISGVVPAPEDVADDDKRRHIELALRYMDLAPGTALTEIPIDRVFIGSCTNARIEDLRAAAAVARGRRAAVSAIVSPGSRSVKRQAEAEGLDVVFAEAGFEWRDSGCSMCVGSNGDVVPPGERCASTSSRNYEGRQGPGARTHLMNPAMAAAVAVTGRITDLRALMAAG